MKASVSQPSEKPTGLSYWPYPNYMEDVYIALEEGHITTDEAKLHAGTIELDDPPLETT